MSERATPKEYRELHDVEGRLRHMDELGIDIQVLYPSILTQYASPQVEGALWKGYNRWMADAWSRSNGRLRWICRIPLARYGPGRERASLRQDPWRLRRLPPQHRR